jgi:hypothetical protein
MNLMINIIRRYPPLRHVVDYEILSKEALQQCPACGADTDKNSILFARLDRYGFPTTTNWCRCCDLIYVNPCPTPAAYKGFYDSGDYRRLISAFSGQEDDHSLGHERVQQVVSLLSAHVPNRPLSVLNIGGTRADYEVLSNHISVSRYVCLNPGEKEAGQGYEVWSQTLETFSPQGDVFDVVCLFGTLNHLTKIGEAFGKIRRMMASDSIFIFDFKDPLTKMARMRQPIGGLQFDHATYPTRRTLGIMLKAAGLGLQDWHTDNKRVYTFIVALDSASVLPDILTPIESSIIDELRLLARRLPRRLALQALRSIISAVK